MSPNGLPSEKKQAYQIVGGATERHYSIPRSFYFCSAIFGWTGSVTSQAGSFPVPFFITSINLRILLPGSMKPKPPRPTVGVCPSMRPRCGLEIVVLRSCAGPLETIPSNLRSPPFKKLNEPSFFKPAGNLITGPPLLPWYKLAAAVTWLGERNAPKKLSI